MDYNHVLMAGSVITTLFPYIMYTVAYKCPRFVQRYLTQKQFIAVAQYTKLVDLACAAPTLYRAGINGAGICIGLPIMFIGQYLNELVYSVLGDSGVYYGLEFGVVKARHISGFPFTISDPQYKGSVMTVIGAAFCFNTTRDLMILTIPWMIAYFYVICVENTKPGK